MERYRFAYDEAGVYGHVVGLLEKTAPRGIVVDLGCGYGAVAEPVAELGWEYLGFDIDPEAIQDLRRRGFAAETLDLSVANLQDVVRTALAGRPLSAVLLLDIVEHVSEHRTFVGQIRELVAAHEGSVVVVSIPNVAHVDLAAKLLTGQWDVTPTGLLDETHLHLFTDRSLTTFMAEVGLKEIQRDDYPLARSDQHFPELHPGLADGSTLHRFIGWIRSQADDHMHVNQFVRAFAPDDPARSDARVGPQQTVFLSVLIRTQGDRPTALADALTCLGAQTDQDFECLVLVHTSDRKAVDRVGRIVDDFEGVVGADLRLLVIEGGLRGVPLNVGLTEARGRYVAFLDDDDEVTASWVETFNLGAAARPGRVVRAKGWARAIDSDDSEEGTGFRLAGWPDLKYGAPFLFVEHLWVNKTPICTFAVPLDAVRAMRLTFDEGLTVHEDWDFLLRAANLLGVSDQDEATSIYQQWIQGESSKSHGPEEWKRTREHVERAWATRPVLLPPEETLRLHKYITRVRELEQKASGAEARVKRAEERAKNAEGAARSAKKELNRIMDSRSWKAGAPLRAIRRLQAAVRASLAREPREPSERRP